MLSSLLPGLALVVASGILALAQPAAAGEPTQVTPIHDPALLKAFHGEAGIRRITADALQRYQHDPRIADIFKGHDLVRLEKELGDHTCWLLGGPCVYSGRNMREAHRNLGLQARDMDALVENLQAAMDKEGVPFSAQNRLLAKLAPMKRDVVER